jgi:hypothetical protein
VEEMVCAKLMVKERLDAKIAVDHHFVGMVDKSSNAKNVVDHRFVNMVKERMDVEIVVAHQFVGMVDKSSNVETAVDLLLVLILPTNTDARSVPLLVLDIMFNVVLIAFCWTQTFEDPGPINFSISDSSAFGNLL